MGVSVGAGPLAGYGPRGDYSGGYSAPSKVSAQQSDPLLGQLNQLWQLGQAAGAPQNAAIDANLAQQLQRLGLLNANQSTQSGLINQGAALSQQRLGLNGQQLGIQQGANARQAPLIEAQHSLATQGLDQQLAQNALGARQQRDALSSQGTVQGAMQSVGSRQGFSDIATQLGFNNATVDRSRWGENLSYGESKAQLADQKKGLDLAAKGLGIDAEELKNRTSQALQQLGLGTALGTSDIVSAMNDLNAGRFNPIQNILPYIYQMVGVRPTAP